MGSTDGVLLSFPGELTASASAFHEQHLANVKQFSISEMVAQHQENFFGIHLRGFRDESEETKRAIYRHFMKFQVLKEYVLETREVRIEVAVTRAVDNFLCYVADILTEAMIARPELLKSEERVSMQEVLKHASIEEFVRWAAERHVNQLSFKGLSAIAEYMKKRLGLGLSEGQEDWGVLKRAVAVRNLIVHRRCIVDERFIHSMGDKTLRRGERYCVPSRMAYQVTFQAMRIVQEFDKRVARKFEIPLLVTADQPWYSAPNGPSALDRERDALAQRGGPTDGMMPGSI